MIQLIQDTILNFQTYVNQNPVLGGVVGLWALSVATVVCRGVPSRIYQFVKRQITVSLTFNNSSYQHGELFSLFDMWFQKTSDKRFSRNFSLSPKDREFAEDDHDNYEKFPTTTGPGFGFHFFFYNKKLYWLNKSKLESSGSQREKEQIILYTFGRSVDCFEKIIEEVTTIPKDNRISMYFYDAYNDEWQCRNTINKRPWESVAINTPIRSKLEYELQHFFDNEEWFIKSGLPYKITFILHGRPGTGKTSIVKSLASLYQRNVCVINIHGISDKSFESALGSIPKKSFVIIEDFDSSSAVKDRGIDYTNTNQNSNSNQKRSDDVPSFLTLSGVLNALDGIVSLNDTVIFMTTNDISSIDPAIYRKGRVDHLVEIDKIDASEVMRYTQYIFPDHTFSESDFDITLGCHLNAALLESKGDPELFIKELKSLSRA